MLRLLGSPLTFCNRDIVVLPMDKVLEVGELQGDESSVVCKGEMPSSWDVVPVVSSSVGNGLAASWL